jgi:hypothetical protein
MQKGLRRRDEALVYRHAKPRPPAVGHFHGFFALTVLIPDRNKIERDE